MVRASVRNAILRKMTKGRLLVMTYNSNTQMTKESKTSKRGRNAGTGVFTSVKEARKHPSTHIVERVPKPGYGDTAKHRK